MDEYIEREVVLKILSRYGMTNGSALGLHSGTVDCAAMEIEQLPAADVALIRRGRWEWNSGDVYSCTCCGEKSHVKEVMENPVWDWCPNCGAMLIFEGR